MIRARAQAALALAALLATTCETVPPAPSRPSAPPPALIEARPTPELAPAKPPPTLRRASGEIAVRLAQLDAVKSFDVFGADVPRARIARASDGAVTKDGVKKSEFVLAPDHERWLRVGEHSYAGRLRVRTRSDGKFEVTNLVDLEDYVAGVVAAEIAVWSAEPEALRAQAIAARSYAVAALDERGRKSRDPYLFDDTRDQAYDGVLINEPAAIRAKIARAVQSTRGKVLIEQGSVVDARFHAACGGATADAPAVFPENVHTCLRSVECEPCKHADDLAWNWTASRAQLDELCKRWSLGARMVELAPSKSDASGRWLEVEITGNSSSKRVPFEDLRRALGAADLRSSRVERTWPRAGEPITNGLRFEGRGRGHGVGLCQNGARGYAREGWNAERILAHYYTGAEIVDFR